MSKHIVLAVGVLLLSCARKSPEPTPKAEPLTKPYTLTVEAPSEARVGAPSQFRISLVPAAGYHINDDGFPFEIELVTAAAKIAKTRLEQGDAKSFGRERANFEIPFVPTQAGAGEYRANVSLAVCRENECIPRKETLSWKTTAATRP